MISDEKLEELRKAVEKLVNIPVSKRKIKSIGVNPRARHIPKMTIEVGQFYSNLEPNAPEEEVIAIFEAVSFCVCTPSRDGVNAPPYYFHREDVFSIEVFDNSN
jgi:hypothetical protein